MSRIFQGTAPDAPIVKGNLVSFVFKDAHHWKNLHALQCGYTGKVYTYGELRDAVGRWGAWLTRHTGGSSGPPMVARFSRCSVELTVVHLGTMAAGAVMAPLTSSFGARELAAQIDGNGATLLVTSAEFVPRLKEALQKLGRQIPVVVIGDASAGATAGMDVVTTYDAIMKDETITPVEPVEISGEETALLMYTSGTTGLPKSVQHTHNTTIEAVRAILHPHFHPSARPTCESDQPKFLLFREIGLSIGLYCLLYGLASGTCLVIKAADEKSFIEDVERFKINTTAIVPPNFPAILSIGKKRPDLLKTFRHFIVGGGATSDVYLKATKDFMPNVFLQRSYGTSESGAISLCPVGGGKHGFTGQLCPNVRAKVLDEHGQMLPHNQRGNLYIKSPAIMKGYLNNPTATREVLDDDGWYNTGDVALVDQDGYVKVFDRVKEMIKLDDAFTASPAEIEGVILEVPGVHEACVVGVQEDRTGMDAIYAFVAREPNFASDVTEDVIKTHVTTILNKQKCPRTVIFIENSLPRNQNDKIDRSRLKREAVRVHSSK